jgi:hypothetical protein
MATAKEREDKLTATKESLNQLAITDVDKLGRVDELSKTINFSEAVPYFRQMVDIIKQFTDRDITRLPYVQLEGIITACNLLNSLIKKVTDFNINQNTPGDVCAGIINDIKNSYDAFMTPLVMPLAFTAVQATDYAKIEREAKGCYTTMKEEQDKLLPFLSKVKDDAMKALAAVQEQAAQAGVTTNAHIFTKDVGNHQNKAKQWFMATIVVSSVTLAAALCFFIVGFMWTPGTNTAAIQYIVNKLLILSALSFGIFWCARNYKAEKHNETLNQHRANALLTFRAFYEGSDDSQVKATILLQAAQAAFGPRPTGFDSQEKEIPMSNPIIEFIGKSMPK